MPSNYKNIGNKPSGDPNIMKIKDVNKVRPLDNLVAGWRQHGVEHPSDPEQFTSVVCPGPRSCPLCRKPVDAQGEQRFSVSRRFAANVWDYDTSSVKVLVGGPAIFDKFKEAATVGIDPDSCDWTITKSGSGLMTRYNVIRHDAAPFTAKVITPDLLHSVDKYEQPDSTETIFEKLEKFGIDYDALEIPSYTYDQALAVVMPYGKHKGLTIEQLIAQDVDYAHYIHSNKLEQGSLGDPIFLAIQTVLEERGLTPGLDDTLATMPGPADTPAPEAAASPTVADPRVALIGPDGAEILVDDSAVAPLLAAGFRRKADAAVPEPDSDAPMKVQIGGNVVELPRSQAMPLIAAGTAQEYTEESAAPEPPALPLPDEQVMVSIGGTEVEMAYVQAAPLVDAGSASFADPGVAEAHARSNAKVAATPDPTASGGTETASTARQHDPEKPFECDQCDAAYKTQGALTQHKNREHKAAEPQPSAVPAASNGSGDLEQRVKDKIAHAPFARDFQKLLTIFDEETGTRNFAEMGPEQLVKLEQRIDKEVAAAK